MIDYQPDMCIAEVHPVWGETGRNDIVLYDGMGNTYRWNVSDRYLEYLNEDPAVPICPPPGW